MLNTMRNKLMALAALAASFVRPGDAVAKVHTPSAWHQADPEFREIRVQRPRSQLKSANAQYPYGFAGSKLCKRFAEAPYRSARGY